MLQASIAATMGAAGGAPPYNSSRALAELNIMVQNPSTQVSAGVQLACYGPFYPPSNAKSLFQMLPVVDMNIVHHMIMFGGTAYSPFREPRANSDLCYRGSIVYAWARTGQKVPIGLNFDSSGSFGDAYAVGEGTAIKWFALQIHYQQLTGRSSMVDNSGVKLWFREQPPTRPLEVELMLSAQIRIPPRVYFDECVTCRVQRGGTAIAYRNHAHRLARDIYSEHFDVDGSPLPQFGRKSAQESQIFRMLDKPVAIHPGQTFLLHCEYDARDAKVPTFVGVDERTHEMCNQYLVSTVGIQLGCSRESMMVHPSFNTGFQQAATQHGGGGVWSGGGYGQVTAVATDAAMKSLYFFHRSDNNFQSTTKIAKPAIIHVDILTGKLKSEFAANTFMVPHGLHMDHKGYLWATDVGVHRVLQLSPDSGKVLLEMGTGRPGGGATGFHAPTDVAVNPRTDEVFVSDGYGNSRVAVFSYSGKFLREWGSPGDGPGQFRIPHSITLDADGNVYVADRENARVQVFDPEGRYKSQWRSRVASLTPSRQAFQRHVSSISYNAQLDAFVVVEGAGFHLRTRSGCEILSIQNAFNWPHDAILLPSAAAASSAIVENAARRGNGTAMSISGREYRVFVAELDGRRVQSYTTGGQNAAASLYG